MSFWYIVHLFAAIWVIVDVINRPDLSSLNKTVWIILALFFSIVTAIIYWIVSKR